MRLPTDVTIATEKLTRYLLVPQVRGDKSSFLAKAGYAVGNADQLAKDLRELGRVEEAVPQNANEFGQYYEVRGELRGPNGKAVRVRTIWMRENLSEVTKFITLLPDKRKR